MTALTPRTIGRVLAGLGITAGYLFMPDWTIKFPEISVPGLLVVTALFVWLYVETWIENRELVAMVMRGQAPLSRPADPDAIFRECCASKIGLEHLAGCPNGCDDVGGAS